MFEGHSGIPLEGIQVSGEIPSYTYPS